MPAEAAGTALQSTRGREECEEREE